VNREVSENRDYKLLTIGDAENNDIRIKKPLEQNVLTEIVSKDGKYIVVDKHSKFGTYINGKVIKEPHVLSDYEFISVAGTSFYYRDNKLIFDIEDVDINNNSNVKIYALQKENKFEYPMFVRNTRRKQRPKEDSIKILDPSQKPSKPEVNIITTIMPSVAMLALVVVLRGVMSSSGGTYVLFSICSMGLGLITTVVNLIQSKKKYKKDLKNRIETYNKYIEGKIREIKTAREEEYKLMNAEYYDTSVGIEKIKNFDSDIFDRIPTDSDFPLCVPWKRYD